MPWDIDDTLPRVAWYYYISQVRAVEATVAVLRRPKEADSGW